MTVKWAFFDPTTSTTTQFDVNPNAGGSPALKKNITTHTTVVSGGSPLIFEGNQPPQTITFSGVVRTEQQYTDLVATFDKSHQVEMSDDLGRTFWIMISEFTPKRERTRHGVPWRHTYTVTATIVDWP